jgi:hypothetical protein
MSSKQGRSLSRTTLAVLALSLMGAGACDGEKKADAANSPKEPSASAESEAAAPIVGKPVEGEKAGPVAVKAGEEKAPYTFSVQKNDDYAQGKEGEVMLALVPAKGWHLNLEYPTKVKLDASEGLGLAKSELKKEDANAFAEEGFEFGVKFTPSTAGEGQVSGKIKFAVCQEEACSPQSEEIAFAVKVN